MKKNISLKFGWAPNNIINDEELSWKAKGLWLYFNSKPDGWNFSINGTTKQGLDGRDSVSSGILELEERGYLVRERLKSEGGKFGGSEYILYDIPLTNDGLSNDGKSNTGKSHTSNTILSKTEEREGSIEKSTLDLKKGLEINVRFNQAKEGDEYYNKVGLLGKLRILYLQELGNKNYLWEKRDQGLLMSIKGKLTQFIILQMKRKQIYVDGQKLKDESYTYLFKIMIQNSRKDSYISENFHLALLNANFNSLITGKKK